MAQQVPPLSRGYRAAIAVVGPALKATTRHEWSGAEHLPAGGFIAAVNHVSHADPFVVAEFLVRNGRPPYFLAKESLFRLPLLGGWLRSCGQIPVYRGTGRAIEAFQSAVSAIEEGKVVVVPVEGTLTRDPDLWPMVGKTGAARIAQLTGCPVVPIAHWGAHRLLEPYGPAHVLPPRKKVQVMAGPAVDLAELYAAAQGDLAAQRRATERIVDALTDQVSQLRDLTPPEGHWDPRLRRRVVRDA